MIYNDHFQNFKRYNLHKAQLIIADIPYNIGKNAYGSNPSWYVDGDRANGESDKAGTEFFDTDKNFKPAEFMHFCSQMLKKEPKEKGQAPAMIVFCAFDQQMYLIELAKRYGLNNYINLVFRKNFSAQVLKANMRVVGNAEYGLIFYRDKLPKFNNNGKMIFNVMDWEKDDISDPLIRKIHPCLPENEKVFFNNKWQNIQDIKVGDTNRYGKVIATTEHYADKLIEITIGNNKTIATWNHPFLVKRENKIFWVIAEQICNNDFVLQNLYVSLYTETIKIKQKWNTKKQKKGTSEEAKTTMEGLDLNIALFGKNIMVKYLSVCRSIIKILTRQTIKLKTYNLSLPLNTSGCTLVADLSMENGKNHVQFVESIKNVIQKIGIFHVAGLMVKFAKNALLKSQSKSETFLFQKVGSVKTINQKTKVYNLTIDNIPAFDTLIGVSHNTQKPVKLLEKLIEIFTDEGEIVIDPVAGSGSTLIACANTNRKGYGFEIKKDFYKQAEEWEKEVLQARKEIKEFGFAKTLVSKTQQTLF